jgi:hypothetical protein
MSQKGGFHTPRIYYSPLRFVAPTRTCIIFREREIADGQARPDVTLCSTKYDDKYVYFEDVVNVGKTVTNAGYIQCEF